MTTTGIVTPSAILMLRWELVDAVALVEGVGDAVLGEGKLVVVLGEVMVAEGTVPADVSEKVVGDTPVVVGGGISVVTRLVKVRVIPIPSLPGSSKVKILVTQYV